MLLENSLAFSHSLLSRHVQAGDIVVDATAGNGHDTVFLAQYVGEYGQVYAFDIQEIALQRTQERLQQAKLAKRVQLIHASHADLAEYVPPNIATVMFNFGYLPGGDKQLSTQTHSSLAALQSALKLLAVGGVVSAVLYPGHFAGAAESAAVLQWAQNLPQQAFSVLQYGFINQRNQPPILLVIEKLRCT
ncbi:class I SAM-dependent methyltransferase [Stenoxybacter acetivorans]|uniref:class I SAM-dependent methyltransferase n=1 Tax=Stenoxybacter acetivorans TaxID=422441 RepID=UPI00055AAB3A|nr:class I SAM-dependent methyltransferase [Stenoxybacter acetivorans]